MTDQPPLPDLETLRLLTRKARAEQHFTTHEYQALANALAFLETDSMYWFKRGAKGEASER